MAKREKKTGYQKYRTFLKIQIVLIIVVFFGACFYYFGGYGATVKLLHDDAVSKVRSSSEDTFRASQTSLVYDVNEELISVIKGEKDVYYINIDEIPQAVKDAFICTEDKKFYRHNGIDLQAIIRAFKGMIENQEIVSGASTITQQLGRNVFLTQEKTWQRKVEEIFIALEMEKIYSKNKILEYYLNNIYFSNGYYGIQAASKGYFSTEVSELSLSQMVFLCAIPNNPTLYDPVKNIENTIKRRDRVLKTMFDEGYISEEEYKEAVEEEISLNMTQTELKNYVETYTYYCATKELMKLEGFKFKNKFASVEEELEYEEEYSKAYSNCQQKLFTAGYRIYTSIDLNKQDILQAEMDNALAEYTTVNKEGVYQLQGAATCIDNTTGYVTAIVGGRTQNDIVGYTLNRAYQSFRQPGSTIKPLIVYTPALERGYSPDSIVKDEPIDNGPVNADNYYAGDISIRQAVTLSKNTVAWKLFEELTPNVGLSYLEAMNFSALEEGDYALPASIGGFTNGTSAVEMAAAYATIENDGVYREPTCIIKITDADGNVIVDTHKEGKQVYKTNACRMMTSMLENVLTEGTAKGNALTMTSSAGKTGTTNDNKDSWFVGYTYYYTTCVWVGYDIPQQLPGQSATYPVKIWNSFMSKIHEGLTPMEFLDYLQ